MCKWQNCAGGRAHCEYRKENQGKTASWSSHSCGIGGVSPLSAQTNPSQVLHGERCRSPVACGLWGQVKPHTNAAAPMVITCAQQASLPSLTLTPVLEQSLNGNFSMGADFCQKHIWKELCTWVSFNLLLYTIQRMAMFNSDSVYFQFYGRNR